MFSMEEKQLIARKLEEILLSLNHPEMRTENPFFQLDVLGKEPWSWVRILPNWTFKENPESTLWNENARKILKKTEGK